MRARGWSRRELLTAGAAASVAGLVGSRAAPALGRGASTKQRLAIVGTGIRGSGLWGRTMMRDYGDVVDLVGLCDTNPGRLAYAKEYIGVGCETFTDFEAMVRKTSPERVIVTTIDATHHELIVRAMELGCDVITEKPLTTDEVKCQAILDAQKATGRDIVVTHNYRYSPHRQRLKELLQAGRIGRLTSVDFHWYLDIHHGADYFRRWHGKRRNSGTLFVHKACHHFDLLNWWVDSEPEIVYAQGALEHYGRNHPFRATKCRGCPHRGECQFYWDITKSEHLTRLYVDNERYDGYLRDGCVWSEEIDIFDKMGAQIRYANGVAASYSCTTYSPYEGYRIAFNGTTGRLEAWVHERQPWPTEDYDELRLTDNFGETELIRVPHSTGGHGGGDVRMQDFIFRTPDGPDPYRQAAGLRDGAMAALLGIAARKSADSGQPVRVGDLTTLDPLPARP